MKRDLGFFLIVFLLSIQLCLGQKENSSALDSIVSIEARNQPIAVVLDQIASQARLYFSYDPQLIGADKKVDASLSSKSVREVLDVLLGSKFSYQVLGNQVIITNMEQPGEKSKLEGTNPHSPVILFRGRVIDQEEKEPLPYVSISILQKNMGTISNKDGDFALKIPPTLVNDTVIVSCLGFRPFRLPISQITDDRVTVLLQPSTIQLREIKVTYISEQEILNRVVSKISLNYPHDEEILTSFYREILQQDKNYIDVAEAVMDIRKASYNNTFAEDKVKLIKGRKSINVQPFEWVDFKIQGGPYYITKLDVIKTLDSFLDPEFYEFYKYTLDEIVTFNDRFTYVLKFKPKEQSDKALYLGKLWVDMSTFALVQAEFELTRRGLKFAQGSLIKKKPKDLYVRPLEVHYQVNYRRTDEKWHLSTARASIDFRVKNKSERINSLFHSTSELLVTDFKPDDQPRFKRDELFGSKDIFTEMINNYDDHFWDDYNIIQPSEELREAMKKYSMENDSLFKRSNPGSVKK